MAGLKRLLDKSQKRILQRLKSLGMTNITGISARLKSCLTQNHREGVFQQAVKSRPDTKQKRAGAFSHACRVEVLFFRLEYKMAA